MIGLVTDAGADPETWTVAHQPTEESGTSFVGGGNLAVFEQSDNKEAGWAFVEYASRPEVQITWYETVSDLPAVQAAWDDPALADDPLLSAFGEQLADAKAPPAIPTWEEVAIGDRRPDRAGDQGDTSPEDGCAGDAGGGGVHRHRSLDERPSSPGGRLTAAPGLAAVVDRVELRRCRSCSSSSGSWAGRSWFR